MATCLFFYNKRRLINANKNPHKHPINLNYSNKLGMSAVAAREFNC